MEPIRVDFVKRQIVMTSRFAKLASKPHTNESEILREQVEAFPTFRVVKHTIKHNKGRESYKGLTYERMRDYIVKHDEVLLEDYEELIRMSKGHSNRYPAIKKWFLDSFPEYKEYIKHFARSEEADEDIDFEEIA